MEQLLKLTTIPMQYQLKVTNAKLEYQNQHPTLTMETTRGGLSMKSRPAKLNIDSSEARNSVLPSPKRVVAQNAQKGIEAAQGTAAQFAQEQRVMFNSSNSGNETLGNIFAQRLHFPTGEFQLGFIPSAPVEMNYQAGDLVTNYEMDKLNFDLKVANGNFNYVAGDIEMSITQYPDLLIEYLGGPIYVPPSADPNYEPLEVRA